MRYRPEIDGLRTLAVLPVLFFHAQLFGFSGGYVGVDVFFVISGYLITSIILNQQSQGSFSFKDFYERRARRILPALNVVLMSSVILGYLFLPAEQYRFFGLSLFSVSTFFSNILFNSSIGYFTPAVDEMPLIHTWSLALEEQFYFIFPVVILLIWKLRRQWQLLILSITLIASLLYSQYLLEQDQVNQAYYLLPSRAWELMIGSLLAYIPKSWSQRHLGLSQILSLLGLVMVVASVFILDELSSFPGFAAIAPVIGSALIILFAIQGTWVARVLSFPPMVWIGLISYSLYLWHQPIFALLRIKSIGQPSELEFLIAIVISVILAVLSFHFIESPFRSRARFSSTKIFILSGVSIILMAGLGLVIFKAQGIPQRFSTGYQLSSDLKSPKRAQCHTQGKDYLKPNKACRLGGTKLKWAALGDSHVVELAYSLGAKLKSQDQSLVQLSFSGCPPALRDSSKLVGCHSWLSEAQDYVLSKDSITHVMVSFRHSLYLMGDQLKAYPQVQAHQVPPVFSEAKGEPLEQYWANYSFLVEQLLQAGKNVVLVDPIPELPTPVSKGMSSWWIFSEGTLFDPVKTLAVEYFYRRNQFILEKLEAFSHPRLTRIKPAQELCSKGYCSATREGELMYFDDNHLSIPAANLIIQSFYK